MVQLTNESIVEFYTIGHKKFSKKDSNEGEVPDVFKTDCFEFSISGQNWTFPKFLKETKLHARVLIKEPGALEYEEKLVTETVIGEISPHFIKTARFQPYTMFNSQKVASETDVRFEAYVNGKLHAHFETTMAKLLWDRSLTAKLDSAGRPLFTNRNSSVKKGRLNVAIVRTRQAEDMDNDDRVKSTLSIDPSCLMDCTNFRFRFGLSKAAERGLWSRVWTSDTFRYNDVMKQKTIMADLKLNELLSGSDGNPLRLELFGLLRNTATVLGYCHFTLAELSERSFINWIPKYNKQPIIVSVNHQETSDLLTEVSLNLQQHTTKDEGKSLSYTRRTRSLRVSSGDRLFKVPSFVSRASGSSTESKSDEHGLSGSSQMESSSSIGTGISQPKCVVRFPTDLS